MRSSSADKSEPRSGVGTMTPENRRKAWLFLRELEIVNELCENIPQTIIYTKADMLQTVEEAELIVEKARARAINEYQEKENKVQK